MIAVVRLRTLLAECIICINEEGERIGVVFQNIVCTPSEKNSTLLLGDLQNHLCLLDIHTVVLWHTHVSIVAEVSEAVLR